jgi:hypothetical protein
MVLGHQPVRRKLVADEIKSEEKTSVKRNLLCHQV